MLLPLAFKTQIKWTIDSSRCYALSSPEVRIDLKGKITVTGDSLKAIERLLNWITEELKHSHKLDSMQTLYKDLANASIDLINDMPTYYRTNSCFWENYVRNVNLNKLGFYKVKPYQFKPCKKTNAPASYNSKNKNK